MKREGRRIILFPRWVASQQAKHFEGFCKSLLIHFYLPEFFQIRLETSSENDQRIERAASTARLEKNFDQAKLYWLNAIAHAQRNQRLGFLKEYSSVLFTEAENDLAFLEDVKQLKTLIEQTSSQVAPEKIDEILELLNKCAEWEHAVVAGILSPEELNKYLSDGRALDLDDEQFKYLLLLVEQLKTSISEVEASRSDNEQFHQLQALVKKMIPDADPEREKTEMAKHASQIARSKEDFVQAQPYWLNALEHAQGDQRLDVLKDYSEALLIYAENDPSYFDDVIQLQSLIQVTSYQVAPDKIQEALELLGRCAQWEESVLSLYVSEEEIVETDELTHEEMRVAETEEIFSVIDRMMSEAERALKEYTPSEYPEQTVPEYKILHLVGTIENMLPQLWIVDRNGLPEELLGKIDSLPDRLENIEKQFSKKHDEPILRDLHRIVEFVKNLQATGKERPHAGCILKCEEYLKEVVEKREKLKHPKSVDESKKVVETIVKKIQSEQREQYNEYQKFVAQVCKFAYDCFEEQMSVKPVNYGRINKNRFDSVDSFITNKIHDFSNDEGLLFVLKNAKTFRTVLSKDSELKDAMGKSTGGFSYHNVKNSEKAFIIMAVYGFYRIDQSLLSVETARLFNDMYAKCYDKMDDYKVESLRWMVKLPKITLEDF